MSLIENNVADDHEAERAVGERSEVVVGRAAPTGVPDPELAERPKRRRFSAEYSSGSWLRPMPAASPLRSARCCAERPLLLAAFELARPARRRGSEGARPPARPKPPDPRDARIAKLERRAERAEAELATAQRVIEVQGNVSALLGDLLKPKSAAERGER